MITYMIFEIHCYDINEAERMSEYFAKQRMNCEFTQKYANYGAGTGSKEKQAIYELHITMQAFDLEKCTTFLEYQQEQEKIEKEFELIYREYLIEANSDLSGEFMYTVANYSVAPPRDIVWER